MQWNDLRGHLRNMYKIIKLYRHGETVWNKEGRLQGWLDSPLTETGRALAEQVQWVPDFVISSDLNRAVETASLMFPHAKLQTDARLREINLGNWQGQDVTVLEKDASYQLYLQQPVHFRGQSQESFEDLAARMFEVLYDVSRLSFEKIALVSHGVAIASVSAMLQEQSFQHIWRYLPKNGEFLEIDSRVLQQI